MFNSFNNKFTKYEHKNVLIESLIPSTTSFATLNPEITFWRQTAHSIQPEFNKVLKTNDLEAYRKSVKRHKKSELDTNQNEKHTIIISKPEPLIPLIHMDDDPNVKIDPKIEIQLSKKENDELNHEKYKDKIIEVTNPTTPVNVTDTNSDANLSAVITSSIAPGPTGIMTNEESKILSTTIDRDDVGMTDYNHKLNQILERQQSLAKKLEDFKLLQENKAAARNEVPLAEKKNVNQYLCDIEYYFGGERRCNRYSIIPNFCCNTCLTNYFNLIVLTDTKEIVAINRNLNWDQLDNQTRQSVPIVFRKNKIIGNLKPFQHLLLDRSSLQDAQTKLSQQIYKHLKSNNFVASNPSEKNCSLMKHRQYGQILVSTKPIEAYSKLML